MWGYWEAFGNPLLKLTELDVVAGRNAASLVDASVELDHNLAGAVVVDLLELSNVAWNGSARGAGIRGSRRLTVLLHDVEELDDDLGRGSDEDLSLPGLLGVVDGVEAIVEDGSLDHFGGWKGLSRARET